MGQSMTGDLAARIRSGILCFCAGDALGVPWEGRPPAEVDVAALEALPGRPGWPQGATSDDTAQLLLLAEVLAGGGDELAFLGRLAAELPSIRGAGPTTAAAVAGFLRDGRPAPGERATNGAAMRAAAIGWAEAEPRRRRELSSAFARTTHAAPEAVEAACAVADLAAAALAGSLPEPAGWDPPAEGVSMDALDTLAAVRHVVAAHHDPAAAMRAAVALGGDTDTVAAIAGGILGCRRAGSELGVPWLHRVELPSPDRVEAIARGLAERRTRG